MCYNDNRKVRNTGVFDSYKQEVCAMCANDWFGFDFNGDGNVSFEESYLTYRISEAIIKNNSDGTFDDDTFDDNFCDDI